MIYWLFRIVLFSIHLLVFLINWKDLKEVEEITKRCQEYTELYTEGLNDPDDHDGVVTHLEPDILKCEVKWS